MKRLEDLPGEVLRCVFSQLVKGTATPDGIFNYFEWEARARARNNPNHQLGLLSSSYDSGLGLDTFDFVRRTQERIFNDFKPVPGLDTVRHLEADLDEEIADDLAFTLSAATPSTLGSKRYVHPLLAMRATSRYMRAAVESYCNTCVLTIHRTAIAENKIEFRPDTPGVPRSTQLIEFIWTRCGFCHRSCNREGLFAWFLRVCEYCEEHHFPTIPEEEVVERYSLDRRVLRDYLTRRRIRAYQDSRKKLHYLEESIIPLAVMVDGKDRVLAQQQERDSQKNLVHQTWLNAASLGLRLNGMDPTVFSGIEHTEAPLEDYNRRLHTPTFKGSTVDEFVRFQILIHLIKTKTKFTTEVLPFLNKLDYLINGGHINEAVRAPRVRTYNTYSFINKIAPDLKFESTYLMLDLMDVALFNLFVVEFHIRHMTSAKRIIKAYLRCAERWTMGFWKGDFQMRGGFTDGPWSLQRYPLRFQTAQSVYESLPTPPPQSAPELEISEMGIITDNQNTMTQEGSTTTQSMSEKRAEMQRYLSGSLDRLLDVQRFRPKLERTLDYGVFPRA
ncbi:hypothetical protein BJ508DRAFT_162383 [Ascobolus immersus RN42]|uniref:Uncharacterized protein n=1 Tax=Ascobolus immersus RN42 TaxID=1160509 RepID=A0A3N4HVS2_ASCIM|nr:hypothetical protein BJ508DRAFT_162383 [Ascobolus immersus RN42]